MKVVSNKINSPKFSYGAAVTTDNFAGKRVILEMRSTLIGFTNWEYAVYRFENATVEHTVEDMFAIQESYVSTGLTKIIEDVVGRSANYFGVCEEGVVKKGSKKMFASKSSYKFISVILAVGLSCYIIFLMYA